MEQLTVDELNCCINGVARNEREIPTFRDALLSKLFRMREELATEQMARETGGTDGQV